MLFSAPFDKELLLLAAEFVSTDHQTLPMTTTGMWADRHYRLSNTEGISASLIRSVIDAVVEQAGARTDFRCVL